MLDKVVVITGPTASGKTNLIHEIVNPNKDLIINFDSRQFYKNFNIGSAKPSLQELRKFNYQLIDFLELDKDISAYEFLKKFLNILKKETSFKKIFLVGGSMFYLDVLKKGLPFSPPISKFLKENLEKKLKEKGLDYLIKIIQKKDPEYYREVDLKNPRRILRALEVIESGYSFSQLRKKRIPPPLDILQISIIQPRNILYKKIEARVEEMFKMGWIEEVENLLKKYPEETITKIKTIGYNEIVSYLQSKLDYQTTVQLIKQKTRHMAKKQLTWLKKENDGFFLVSSYNKDEQNNNYKNDFWIKEKLLLSNDKKNNWIITDGLVETSKQIIEKFYG